MNINDFFWYKDKNILADTDSQYSRIIVAQSIEENTSKPIIVLFTGRYFYRFGGFQSAIYSEESDQLPAYYLNFFKLGEFYKTDIKKALLIGGGSYTFPMDLIKRKGDIYLDVVEIDPKLTIIARNYFRFKDNKYISIINADGRSFISRNV